MANISVSKLSAFSILVCMMIASHHALADISCVQVIRNVAPCINYLRNEGALTVACCSGVKSVNSAAKSTNDRQTACGCLKNTARSIPGLNPGLLSSLPGKCGVNLPFKVSVDIDCSRVK